MYGLTNDTIQAIQEVFAKYPDVEKAILYGSRAKGNYRPGSDIDLTLSGEKLTLSTLQKIENELDDLLLPYKIDLSVFQHIGNPDLVAHIERVGQVFYQKVTSMSEWKNYKLSEAVDISTGYAFKGDEYEFKGSLRVVRGENVTIGNLRWDSEKYWNKSTENLEQYLLEENDIVVGMDGSRVGHNRAKIRYKELPLILAQRVARLRAKSNFDQSYLWYHIFSDNFKDYVEAIHTGTSIPHISQKQIADFEIFAPKSKLEQTAIASILSSLDDKIDLLHRQNATLEKMAETLFRQWFVEPIKKITNEGTQVDGYLNGKLGKWISETIGGEWGKENAEGDFNKAVYCIRGTDIADLNIGLPGKTPIRYVKESKFKNIEPNEGDLIIEISGGTESQSTGRVCYINQDIKNLFDYPLVFSNFCRMIRVKKPEYSFFLYCYIQYLYNQDEFFNLENGSSGIKNLDYKALLFELEYPMPTEKLVIDFNSHVKPLFKKVNQNKTQIRTLTTLRDTLLPKLMSGEVKIYL